MSDANCRFGMPKAAASSTGHDLSTDSPQNKHFFWNVKFFGPVRGWVDLKQRGERVGAFS